METNIKEIKGKLIMKCKCGASIRINNNPDRWYVLEHVDRDGCGFYEVGFRK
jgi:hypothetical protein